MVPSTPEPAPERPQASALRNSKERQNENGCQTSSRTSRLEITNRAQPTCQKAAPAGAFRRRRNAWRPFRFRSLWTLSGLLQEPHNGTDRRAAVGVGSGVGFTHEDGSDVSRRKDQYYGKSRSFARSATYAK